MPCPPTTEPEERRRILKAFEQAAAAFKQLGLSAAKTRDAFVMLGEVIRENDADRLKVIAVVSNAVIDIIRERARGPLP